MKKRKAALNLAIAILSTLIALVAAFGMQGRVRHVDIVTLFFGGVGSGAGIVAAAAKIRERRPNLFPAMKYQDGPAAVAWLGKVFGFTERTVMLDPEGRITHAEMALGPGVLMLGSLGKPDSSNPWSTTAQALYVYVKEVDAHHARARAAGATIVRELHDTAYGAREYSARDLEGRLWSFGTYYPED